MPRVRFDMGNGQFKEVETEAGKTILQISLDNGIPQEHACGGNGFCTTCMCEVTEGMANTSPRNEREENMGVVDDPKRLGCQTQVMGDVTVKLLEE